eukprot:403356466
MVFQNEEDQTHDLVISVTYQGDQSPDYFVFGGYHGSNAIIGSYYPGYIIGGVKWMKELIFKQPIQTTKVESLYIFESKKITFAAIRSYKSNQVPYSYVYVRLDNTDGSILAQAQLLQTTFMASFIEQLVVVTSGEDYMFLAQSNEQVHMIRLKSNLQEVQGQVKLSKYNSYARAFTYDSASERLFLGFQAKDKELNPNVNYLGFYIQWGGQRKGGLLKLDPSQQQNQLVTIKQITHFQKYVFACLSNAVNYNDYNYVGYAMMDSENVLLSFAFIGVLLPGPYIYEDRRIFVSECLNIQYLEQQKPIVKIYYTLTHSDGQSIVILESALGIDYEGYPTESQLNLIVDAKILPTMTFNGAMKFEYFHSTNVKNSDTHYYVGFQYTSKAKRGIIHSEIAQSQCSSYENAELPPVQLTLKYFHKKEDMQQGQIVVRKTCVESNDLYTLLKIVSYPRGDQVVTENQSTSPDGCIPSDEQIKVYYEDPEPISQSILIVSEYLKIDFSDQITSTVDIRKFQRRDQDIVSCKNVKLNPYIRVSNQQEKISCKLNDPCNQQVADYFIDGCTDESKGTVQYEMNDVNGTLLTTQNLFPKWGERQYVMAGNSLNFSVAPTDINDIGFHLIKITAALLVNRNVVYEQYEDVIFTLEIYDDCSRSLEIVQISEATKDQLYIIGDKTLTIDKNQMSFRFRNINCIPSQVLEDYTSFIDTDNKNVSIPTSITNNVNTNKFDVYTNNPQDVNKYEIIHRYTVLYNQIILTKSVSFFLTISPKQEQFIIENTAPYFMKRPLDFKIFAEDSQDYYFPSMLDLENDTIKIGWSADSAQTFCVLHKDYLSISPSIKNIGVHEIELILIDNNIKPLKTKYKMSITVVIDPDTIPYELEDLNEDYNMAKKLEISGYLSAKILKITNNAEVIIQFDRNLKIPKNFTQTLCKSLVLYFEQYDKLPQKINFTINQLKKDKMYLSVQFKDSSLISISNLQRNQSMEQELGHQTVYQAL